MTPLSIDHVGRTQEHTQRIRSFAALLLLVLLAEHVIGQGMNWATARRSGWSGSTRTRAIDAVLAQDAGPSGRRALLAV